MQIETVHAREVFDSRGRPTVEVEIACGGRTGRAIVPSGASTGAAEALELRDRDARRLDGLGVQAAVANANGEIAQALRGMDAGDQLSIDRRLIELDATPNKARLGANAILGASLAVAHAAAAARRVLLVEHLRELWLRLRPAPTQAATSMTLNRESRMVMPLPMVNMISGGLHAGGNLDFQDFLAVPVGAESYPQALDWIVSVYRQLARVLGQAGYESTLVGDEGGFGPRLKGNEEAIQLLVQAIDAAGLAAGDQIAIALDVASSHFYRDGRYHLQGQPSMSSDNMIDLLESWVERYPIVSIEDGLAEDDWAGWRALTDRLGRRVKLVGDDLFTTLTSRIARGIETQTANSVLIKVNQVGTLWETLEAIRLSLDNGYLPVVSARSGETEDVTIADLAVATGAGQIKIGSVARSERLAKYNQLLRLNESLGDRVVWLGGKIFS